MTQKITFAFIIILFAHNSFAQSKGDKIFNADILHVLQFYSDTEQNLYELLQNEAIGFERPYHLVSMIFDGEEIDSIGLRAKGFFSASDPDQTPLKIDINEYVEGRTFDGIKKFGLTNSFLDDYRQKDRVSYELFRRSGIASPRTAYVEVYVNDVFINVYLLVQQIDETFIKDHFSDKGSLLKIDELIWGEQDIFDSLNNASSIERLQLVHLRNYMKLMLINLLVAAEDNYPVNNYYVYHSEKENTFHHLPWDYNYSMDVSAPQGFTLEPSNDFDEIWNNPVNKSIYLEIACELKDYLLDETYINNLLSNNQTIILSNSQGATVSDASTLKTYLMERHQWLSQRLLAEGANCGSLFYPLEIGDLVINEFVAKSDSLGGVQEPNGGTPDWIELYNNTDEPIVLDHHFYLSDDVDFPKKWNFESPVTIPANGYQIIWADRDVQQQGVHANFKIEKSEGDLMLIYEDLTIIDEVSYTEQELNKGYARIPNGTGDFTIQDYTFNTNNGTSSAESTIDDFKNISVYPNPTTQSISIISSELIENTKVFSANGNLLMQSKNGNQSLDIEHITSGIYFIQVQTGNKNKVIRFIKQ